MCLEGFEVWEVGPLARVRGAGALGPEPNISRSAASPESLLDFEVSF